MRRGSGLIIGTLVFAMALTSCTSVTGTGETAPSPTPIPSRTAESEDAAARARAEMWLSATTLPPGAVRSTDPLTGFSSMTGWPCGPVHELEAFWTISDATVSDTANWIRENPTPGLLSTAVGPVADDPALTSSIVGYVPAPDAQEGIVYTIEEAGDGVAVRAEVAALTASASCPPLPDGGTYGPPGQG